MADRSVPLIKKDDEENFEVSCMMFNARLGSFQFNLCMFSFASVYNGWMICNVPESIERRIFSSAANTETAI